ncbi:MAG TPA: single-stranded DNA-binding protein [Nitriliruptorales bacterium]
MAYESNFVTMIGNLTDDPDLRFLPSGAPVCNFRIASNRRWKDKQGQQQEETTFIDVNVWREYGENVAESLHKGDRVIVIGRLRIRSYQAQDGSTRWVTEIEADEVAPSLRWARAQISKSSGSSGSSSSGDGDDDFVPPPPAPTDDVPF